VSNDLKVTNLYGGFFFKESLIVYFREYIRVSGSFSNVHPIIATIDGGGSSLLSLSRNCSSKLPLHCVGTVGLLNT